MNNECCKKARAEALREALERFKARWKYITAATVGFENDLRALASGAAPSKKEGGE